jgi:hypothetical protein
MKILQLTYSVNIQSVKINNYFILLNYGFATIVKKTLTNTNNNNNIVSNRAK